MDQVLGSVFHFLITSKFYLNTTGVGTDHLHFSAEEFETQKGELAPRPKAIRAKASF